MSYKHIKMPEKGEKITIKDNALFVPNEPIIPYIEGDGIGADIWRASQTVFDEAVKKAYKGNREIHWVEVYAGEKANGLYGSYLPEETLDVIKDYYVAIKGPLTTPIGTGIKSLNVTLRQMLDLYACIRPVRYFSGTPSPMKNPELIDMVVFRENKEDVYSGLEWQEGSKEALMIIDFLKDKMGKEVRFDSGIGIKPMSRNASRRIMKKALDYAIENNRKSVTIVHKGNIMKYTEGAFLNWCYEYAKEEYNGKVILESELDGKNESSKIIIKDRIADAMFQQVLLRPSEYDIIVTMNLNGDYLSDALAAQVGGLGMAPGSNIGDYHAIFEATHGTAPKYTGQDKVNPGSLILSGVLMLEYIGWKEAAVMIKKAIEETINKKIVTYDLARQIDGAKEVKTSEFAAEICRNMA